MFPWKVVRHMQDCQLEVCPPIMAACVADADIIFLPCGLFEMSLKCAARGSLEMHDAKSRHLGTIAQICRAISSQRSHVLTIEKKFIKQQYLLYMF